MTAPLPRRATSRQQTPPPRRHPHNLTREDVEGYPDGKPRWVVVCTQCGSDDLANVGFRAMQSNGGYTACCQTLAKQLDRGIWEERT